MELPPMYSTWSEAALISVPLVFWPCFFPCCIKWSFQRGWRWAAWWCPCKLSVALSNATVAAGLVSASSWGKAQSWLELRVYPNTAQLPAAAEPPGWGQHAEERTENPSGVCHRACRGFIGSCGSVAGHWLWFHSSGWVSASGCAFRLETAHVF